jgi:hypothetical protein
MFSNINTCSLQNDPWVQRKLHKSIAARGPESWPLVLAEDSGSEGNLCDGFELHLPWTWDFLDSVPESGGDAQVFQQSSKPIGENWSFDPEGLHLIRISVHLLILNVA